MQSVETLLKRLEVIIKQVQLCFDLKLDGKKCEQL